MTASCRLVSQTTCGEMQHAIGCETKLTDGIQEQLLHIVVQTPSRCSSHEYINELHGYHNSCDNTDSKPSCSNKRNRTAHSESASTSAIPTPHFDLTKVTNTDG